MAGPTDATSRGWSRWDLVAAAAIVVAAALLLRCAWTTHPVCGAWLDDSIYLATSKALAEGHGYRHLWLPTEPYQTKYPILWPLVLAPVWWLTSDLERAVDFAQALTVALWTIGCGLSYVLLRRQFELPWWLAGTAVVAAIVNPRTLDLVAAPMAEPLFLVTTTAALLLGTADRRPIASAGLAGLAAAAACLTRSVGLAALAAVLLGYVVRRRWRDAGVALIAPLIVLGGWNLWQRHAHASNSANPANAIYEYDLGYQSWILLDQAARVAWMNTADVLVSTLELLGSLPSPLIDGRLAPGQSFAWSVYVPAIVLALLIIAGWLAVLRARTAPVQLYLAAYVALILVWPFSMRRFLVPLLPLLVAGLLLGIAWLVALAAGRARGAATPGRRRWDLLGAWESDLLRTATFIIAGLLILPGTVTLALAKAHPGLTQEFARREAAAELIVRRTPEDAVVTLRDGAFFYLRTGRKCVPTILTYDPVKLYYAEGRRWSSAARYLSPQGLEYDEQNIRENLLRWIDGSGASYVMSYPDLDSLARCLDELTRRLPGRLVPVGVTDVSRYRLPGSAGPDPPPDVLLRYIRPTGA
ncbi:MAG: hypothetical protein IPM13_12440 [Phycisphaerales bacterium]|nr:hypothetical protein [Phycisphaerales bacterium]